MRHAKLAGLIAAALLSCGGTAARADTVMQQCGQQYQAAKAANTLNGMTWNQFRTDCAAKLKAQPASATTTTTPAPAAPPVKTVAPAAPVAPAPAPATAANPLNPTPAAPATPTTAAVAPSAGTTAASAGRVAFVARERECGSEWRANKTTLVAQTPGLTWPKYLSQCNTRLKAAGK